jgi:hypothetical protein
MPTKIGLHYQGGLQVVSDEAKGESVNAEFVSVDLLWTLRRMAPTSETCSMLWTVSRYNSFDPERTLDPSIVPVSRFWIFLNASFQAQHLLVLAHAPAIRCYSPARATTSTLSGVGPTFAVLAGERDAESPAAGRSTSHCIHFMLACLASGHRSHCFVTSV